MLNKKANLLHQCSKNCMNFKDLLVFQLSTCTVYMYNDVWFVRNFEERLKGRVRKAKLWNGIIFLKSIHGARVFLPVIMYLSRI